MDTIVALITPPGRSGIGVIRLSGSDSLSILRKLVSDHNFSPVARRAVLKKINNPQTSELIDEGVITYFQSPQSFTGEDVIEISTHGSPVVLRQILDICLSLNARSANPGEFSLRALANGRINLSQAEAIRDLIDSQTSASARQAVRQLRGELSARLQPLKDKLLNAIVLLESNLEFVEDDLPEYELKQLKENLTAIKSEISTIASTFRAGRLLREGLKITLAGRPNVGKSSIFNALVGYERAIVTNIPGTTRDSLYENLTVGGIPVSLIDTAGLRETIDEVETIGVERTKQIMADADLVIVVLDSSQPLTVEDQEVLSETEILNRIITLNKIDLDTSRDLTDDYSGNLKNSVKISAKTGNGLSDLIDEIIARFSLQNIAGKEIMVSNARHFDLLTRAETEITNSITMIDSGNSEEIILIGLHNSLKYLGEITGEITTEDMLTRIFSTFCIGK